MTTKTANNTNARPRVLVLMSTMELSGPAKGVLQLLDDFSRRDMSYSLCNIVASASTAAGFTAGAARHGIPVRKVERAAFGYIALITACVRIARENKANIVQTHAFLPSYVCFFLKLILGVKWICFLHGTTTENLKVRLFHRIESVLQLYADRVVLVTERQRRKYPGGGDHARVQVIHNAVDPDMPAKTSMSKSALRTLGDFEPSTRFIVVVGRLSPEKGVDVFLDAMAHLVRGHVPSVCGVIVGDGQERAKLEERTRALGLDKKVVFTGFSATPGDYMRDADCVVLPSRSEGIANVALEAMALGRAVVATAVGGTPEIIEDGVSGLLVPSCRPLFLADAIEKVLTDKELSSRIAQGARKRIREKFSIGPRCDRVFRLYESVLEGRKEEPRNVNAVGRTT